jgi:hypothetical protein
MLREKFQWFLSGRKGAAAAVKKVVGSENLFGQLANYSTFSFLLLSCRCHSFPAAKSYE